jgi:SAM-dependent methyltransferase
MTDRLYTDHLYTERVRAGEPGFDAHLARYRHADALLAHDLRVLDAGCGAGFGAALLAAGGRRVVAVDADEAAVAQARAEGVEALHADVLELPFEDASFDAVVCFEVIEHVHDPARLVDELARVLVAGGTLILSTPNERMERLHERARGRGPNPHHVSTLTPRRLRATLARRFRDVRLYGQAQDRGPLHALLQSLDPFGLRLRLSPARREVARGVLPGATGSAGERVPYRFSRLLSRSAAITLAHASRR